MKKEIALSEHFDYGKLFRFTLPSIAMMIFTSIYGVVDGLFVSNIVGKAEFTAVNFIMPVLMVTGSVGFMFGAGGSALVAKTLGEGRHEKANELFSLFVYVSFAVGVVLAALGVIFMPTVAEALNAGDLLDDCVLYGRIVVSVMPMFMLQMEFQSLFITAEKPKLGFAVTVASGVLNMILDALFMGAFGWGVAGAAAATAMSQVCGGAVPLVYFFRKNTSLLRLGKTRFDIRAVGKACANGSSELVSQASMSVVNMLYNTQLKRYVGDDGVAAYGIMMYVNMIFLAIFIGYSVGTAPVIGYHYGAKNTDELKSLRRKSTLIIMAVSAVMFVAAQLLASPLAAMFSASDEGLEALTTHGFRIFSCLFLFAGLNIFGSSMFTALNNGLISALISFLRTLVFQISAVMLLPLIFKVDGIWASAVAAELISGVITVVFIAAKRKKYGY
ncbi:MAG: MATE family efflux transporter [Lachnospiraceae bacterium]|nr:MATE family efflux transporter [Ruminococcus sp.]MCM1276160.1 MATE family efflux transporter [Lachnospiraceae bacterium]